MSRTVTCVLLCGLTLALGGCASLAYHKERSPSNGAYLQQILVTSSPSGARVSVGGAVLGVTPLHVAISRREAHARLHVELDGYETRDVTLPRSLSGYLASDVALGVIPWSPMFGVSDTGTGSGPSLTTRAGLSIGVWSALLLVDFASGAAFKHRSSVHVTLTKKAANNTRPADDHRAR